MAAIAKTWATSMLSKDTRPASRAVASHCRKANGSLSCSRTFVIAWRDASVIVQWTPRSARIRPSAAGIVGREVAMRCLTGSESRTPRLSCNAHGNLGGSADLLLPIPNEPTLVGLQVFEQAAQFNVAFVF